MDGLESTHRMSTVQGSPRVYQRRDGRFVVAHDEDGVTFIGKLTLVPRKTDLNRFEDTLSSARKMLEEGITAGVADDALALFDFRIFHALETLREALNP
jgi:hypothetical protein